MNSYRSFSGNVAGFHVKRNDFGKHMPNDEWKEKNARTHTKFWVESMYHGQWMWARAIV